MIIVYRQLRKSAEADLQLDALVARASNVGLCLIKPDCEAASDQNIQQALHYTVTLGLVDSGGWLGLATGQCVQLPHVTENIAGLCTFEIRCQRETLDIAIEAS